MGNLGLLDRSHKFVRNGDSCNSDGPCVQSVTTDMCLPAKCDYECDMPIHCVLRWIRAITKADPPDFWTGNALYHN